MFAAVRRLTGLSAAGSSVSHWLAEDGDAVRLRETAPAVPRIFGLLSFRSERASHGVARRTGCGQLCASARFGSFQPGRTKWHV